MNRGVVLLVEDDEAMRLLLEEEFREAGFAVFTAIEGEEALAQLARRHIDAVVADVRMPGMKGDELAQRMQSEFPDVPIVLITAFGSIESAVEAMKFGAYSYVAKPFRIAQLIGTVTSAIEEKRLGAVTYAPPLTTLPGGREIIAESAAMRRVLDLVARAARTESSVLITGESGTGKELIARALHHGGSRTSRAFVAINCAAIPETLLESQLFGHRKGAFTDAREDRRGLFQEAEGGTLFLDEVGDLPLTTQSKLLRVLQEREVHPLGAPAPIPIDVRVIAATHRDLDALTADGRFRQDLYYRLNVINLVIPPLREREEDLLALVAYLARKHADRLGRAEVGFSSAALEAIRRHPWLGNVRELENAIESAAALARTDRIELSDLPAGVRASSAERTLDTAGLPMADVEREHILRTLRSVGGNKAETARSLGLDRKTLYRKLREYGLS